MDIADLYDYEIARIQPAWQRLQAKWSRKPNTRHNLEEFAKEAYDEFLKLGFVVNVRWENNLIIDPGTMQPYPIEIEFLGRTPGADEDTIGFDHEKKRAEVLLSRDRGERYAGERYKPIE